MLQRVCLAAAGMLLLAGCVTVGPDYHRPQSVTPAQWASDLQAGLTAQPSDPSTLRRWWAVLDDPILMTLMERAQAGNLDLRQAEARLRAARAQRGIAKADLFPTVSANGSARRTRSSEETQGDVPGDASPSLTGNHFANSFDASWELDLFGGKRRALESATATVQASQEAVRDVLVSLFAEVALNYVEVRSYQARLSITEASLSSQHETYKITRWRQEAGLTTQLDVDQARRSLETTRATIPSLRTNLEQAGQRLAVLLGQPPGALKELLREPKPVPVTPKEIAVGVPADILRQRPDVRQAERQLAAQTAQIGVATAERYPKFTLAGSIGLEAIEASNLYTAGARTAQALAQAAWTLFDGGRIRQQIAVETAKQEEALNHYEATVLSGLEEVESALIAYGDEQERRQALAEAVAAGQSAFTIARQQYDAGLIDFQTVLDTQRTLLLVQEQLAISEAEITSDLIRLYKALGGGWERFEEKK